MHIREVVRFLWFAAVVVSIRRVMIVIVDVEHAFALVDYVASEYFNIDPFVVL